jgi:hypothetical protein
MALVSLFLRFSDYGESIRARVNGLLAMGHSIPEIEFIVTTEFCDFEPQIFAARRERIERIQDPKTRASTIPMTRVEAIIKDTYDRIDKIRAEGASKVAEIIRRADEIRAEADAVHAETEDIRARTRALEAESSSHNAEMERELRAAKERSKALWEETSMRAASPEPKLGDDPEMVALQESHNARMEEMRARIAASKGRTAKINADAEAEKVAIQEAKAATVGAQSRQIRAEAETAQLRGTQARVSDKKKVPPPPRKGVAEKTQPSASRKMPEEENCQVA